MGDLSNLFRSVELIICLLFLNVWSFERNSLPFLPQKLPRKRCLIKDSGHSKPNSGHTSFYSSPRYSCFLGSSLGCPCVDFRPSHVYCSILQITRPRKMTKGREGEFWSRGDNPSPLKTHPSSPIFYFIFLSSFISKILLLTITS